MSWKMQSLLVVSSFVLGAAVVLGSRSGERPPDPTSFSSVSPPSSVTHPSNAPVNPDLFEQYRAAYRATLAETAPPGMMDLLTPPEELTSPTETR